MENLSFDQKSFISSLAATTSDIDASDSSIFDKLSICLLIDELRSDSIKVTINLLKQNPKVLLESNLLKNLSQLLRDRDITTILPILECLYISFKSECLYIRKEMLVDKFNILTLIVEILRDLNSSAPVINKCLELLVHLSCQPDIYEKLQNEELGLIDVLINRFMTIDYTDERCNSLRILWNISEFCPIENSCVAKRFIQLNLHQLVIGILNLAVNSMNFEFDIDQLFGMLMNFSRHDITREELLKLGANDILIKICNDFENFNYIMQPQELATKLTIKTVQIPAYIIYAFLLGSNEIIDTDKKIIETLIQILEEIISDEKDADKLGYPYGLFVSRLILHAIFRISISENNKITLVDLQIVPLLYQIINDFYSRKPSTFLGGGESDWESLEYALETLSQLSFELTKDKSIDRLLEVFCTSRGDIFELISKISSDDTIVKPPNIKRSLTQLTRGNFETLLSRQPSMNNIADESRAHVMISYCHSDKEIARGLATELRELGYDVWVDIQGSEILGPCKDIGENLVEAVERAGFVIACLSKSYQESTSCRRELKYSDDVHKKIVYCMVNESIIEKHVRAKWLRWQMEDAIYLTLFNSEVKKIAKRISEIIDEDPKLSLKMKKIKFTGKRKSNELLLAGGGRGNSNDTSGTSIGDIDDFSVSQKQIRVDSLISSYDDNQQSNGDNDKIKKAFDIIMNIDSAEDQLAYKNYLKKIGLDNLEGFMYMLEELPSDVKELLSHLKKLKKGQVCKLLGIN